MGKQVELASHLSLEELERRYRQAREATERSWWQILWLLEHGQSARRGAEYGLFGVLDWASGPALQRAGTRRDG